ncbi:DUF5079 family protein [Staphylococcus aureus]|uniref:DUF5079 family protein n=1 Tax=Staphylococcus aureus TaxID=1280 RepID=UPI000DA71882|nr:DUF5079 family protein [Staphylococcus aureus]PZJ37801.1 DUF5079 domain-containing protein [Staphylococcus aureus]
MATKENIDILRKPGAQALSLASLFMILFSCLTFFFGLDYERFPNYLKITTIIELIIIIISLLQWIRFIDFEKERAQKYKKIYARFLVVINVLTTITAVFATCNLYYFVALQNHYDLFNYWLMGTISIIISYLLLVIGGMFTLLKLPKVTKRWGGKTKTHFGLLLTALSAFIYIERIIEYILVPNVVESKFVIMVSINIIVCTKFAAYKIIMHYSRFYIFDLNNEFDP